MTVSAAEATAPSGLMPAAETTAVPPAEAAAKWGRTVAPSRVVIDAIRRVGHHQVRRDTAEDTLDVSRDGAVAAEEAVPPHDPQVARLGGRMLGRRRHIVGVRPSFRPIGEKFTKLEVVEPGQR